MKILKLFLLVFTGILVFSFPSISNARHMTAEQFVQYAKQNDLRLDYFKTVNIYGEKDKMPTIRLASGIPMVFGLNFPAARYDIYARISERGGEPYAWVNIQYSVEGDCLDISPKSINFAYLLSNLQDCGFFTFEPQAINWDKQTARYSYFCQTPNLTYYTVNILKNVSGITVTGRDGRIIPIVRRDHDKDLKKISKAMSHLSYLLE